MEEKPTKRRGPLSWLAVRSWRFWFVTAIALPLLYIASFGPVCWIIAQAGPAYTPHRWTVVYCPLLRLAVRSELTGMAVLWWATVGVREGHSVLLIDFDGTSMVLNMPNMADH